MEDVDSESPQKKKVCIRLPEAMPVSCVDEIANSVQGSGESCLNKNVSSNLHPLLDIELVLENVLSYLDTGCLKVANLVCKAWSNAARKMIVNKMMFSFTETTAVSFLENVDTANQVLHLIKDNLKENAISLKFRVEHLECKESMCLKKKLEDTISVTTAVSLIEKLVNLNMNIGLNLELCSKSLQSAWRIIHTASYRLLQLNIDTDCACSKKLVPPEVEMDFLNEMLMRLTFLSFPNLKVLSGRYIDCLFDMGSKASIVFKHILLGSSALESLDCRFFSISGNHERYIFDVLERKPDLLRNLKSLSCGCLNQADLKVLLEQDLKLKSLSFTLFCGFRGPEMCQFLSSQGQYLEKLSINFGGLPNSPEQFSCGIDLVKLRHLSLSQFFGSIHFVSYMPNLESLTLNDMNLSVALHDEAAKHNYKSQLKCLRIFGGKGSTGRFLLPSVYHEIVTFFPELTCLRMEYFTDSTLKIIVTGLPKLEELEIPNGIYSDIVITGLWDADGVERVKYDKPMCLADLKKLRKVVLQSPKITDYSVQLGLLLCRELRSICIDSPMISDKSLKQLSHLTDLRYLELTNCYQLTPSAVREAKRVWGNGRPLVISHQ